MDLPTCIRSRATRRTVIDKLLVVLDNAVQAGDAIAVEVELEKLKQKEFDIRVVHQTMEILILSDPAADDDEIVSNEDYQDKIVAHKVMANRFLADQRNKAKITTPGVVTPVKSSASVVKLPKLQISVFKGEIGDWERFWDQYQAGVANNTAISKIDKFNYLKSLLAETAQLTIAGLSLTEANYDIAVNLLKDKYGKTEVLIAEHIQKLWSTKRIARIEDGSELRRMLEQFKMHINSLEKLGQDVSSMGAVFCHILLQALPRPLILEWNRKNPASLNNDLPSLVAFVKVEIEGIELAHRISNLRQEDADKKGEKPKLSKPQRLGPSTASSLVATGSSQTNNNKVAEKRSPFCILCNSFSHWSSDCEEFSSNHARREALKKARRCFNCLQKNHTFKDCEKVVTCYKCKKRHQTMLCGSRDRFTSEPGVGTERKDRPQVKVDIPVKESKSTLVASAVARNNSKTISVLQTMKLWIRHKGGLEPVTVLFDGGSERSFITKRVVDKLQLQVQDQEELVVHSFGGKKERQRSAKVNVSLVGHNEMELKMNALQVQEICTGVKVWDSAKIENFLQSRRIFSWNQAMGPGEVASVDLLIGADWYWPAMTGHMKRLTSFLMATQSIFGWMLQGRVEAYAQNIRVVSMFTTATSDEDLESLDLDKRLAMLWELDRSGTMAEEERESRTLKEVEVLKQFEETTIQVNGRYQVRIPWSQNKDQLGRNYYVAKERLDRLLRKMRRNPELLERYNDGMKEYLSNGHIEEVTEVEAQGNPVYYMPHQPVIKEDRKTTKLRIVFDASSHESERLSLNQCQHAGPNLNPAIFELLLRFRWYQVAFSSDMEKAFLQILLAPEDRDATRFLWIKEEDRWAEEPAIKTFRMTRVLFGMKSSPFLLAATIRHHAKAVQTSNPTLYQMFDQSTYVDDVVSGADSTEEAYQLCAQGKELMQKGCMNLVKWATNDEALRQKWIQEGISSPDENVELLKVLGLIWDTKLDVLAYKSEGILEAAAQKALTKRGILEVVARLFDPLGFLAPKVIQAKGLLQKLWKLKIGWDEEIPEEIQESWKNWVEDLQNLKDLKIARCCSIPPNSKVVYQLHTFCDASLASYGALTYLRIEMENQPTVVRLVAAKSRIAPTKVVSIPRLELLAALMAVRLVTTIRRVWTTLSCKNFIWSDSKVVLCWIKGVPADWKVFVARRVQEIQLCEAEWRYCNTKENVADQLTRGRTLQQLKDDSTWWEGPEWLKEKIGKWPSTTLKMEDEEEDGACKEEVEPIATQLATINEPLFPVDRFESWEKITRVTAWIQRFVKNCQKKEKVSESYLSYPELQQAENFWWKFMQATEFQEEIQSLQKGVALPSSSPILKFNPILDQQGLLRVGGRLKYANLSEELKHPVLLKGSVLTEALIRHRHSQLHHGGVQETLLKLRKTVWVLRGRQTVRKALRNCFVCRKWAAKPPVVIEAPLPAARITEASPFSVSGVDYAGPVWIRQKGEKTKGYICVFTCAVTRAVHLELVSSQEINHFILALRRFVARRGSCRILYSDNSKTYAQADRLLQEAAKNTDKNAVQDKVTQLNIQWRFIPPRAAWWGGMYERIVGSVKRHLRRTLGTALLDADEFATILAEIESVINNRPLIAVTEDPEDLSYLTPAHFLLGRQNESIGDLIPSIGSSPVKANLVKRWKYRQRLMRQYWSKWKDEYILQLQTMHQVKNPNSKDRVKLGDVVLKKEDKIPRGQWKLAKIVELTTGRDGEIRSVLLKLGDGQIMRRAVQHICPLEIAN